MQGHGLRVQVTTLDGRPFDDVESGGLHYVVAQPAKAFLVTASYTPPTAILLTAPSDTRYMLELRVDGQSIGYTKLGVAGQVVTFDGFLTSSSNGMRTLRQFKFASTRAEDSTGAGGNPEPSSQGRLALRAWQAVKSETPRAAGSHTVTAPEGGGGVKPEGKFFMQPSLQTVGGAVVRRPSGHSRWSHGQVLTEPFVIRYETAPVLLLRKVLSPADPEHLRLLTRANDPIVDALLAPGGAGPEIDLTQPETVPLTVGGRVVKDDEEAVCDLTLESDGDDDRDDEEQDEEEGGERREGRSAGKWEVRKKPKIEVEDG